MYKTIYIYIYMYIYIYIYIYMIGSTLRRFCMSRPNVSFRTFNSSPRNTEIRTILKTTHSDNKSTPRSWQPAKSRLSRIQTVLYYPILSSPILYYTILRYTILYFTILCYTTSTPRSWKRRTPNPPRGALFRGSWLLYQCIYMYLYIYIYICIHICQCIYIYIYMYIYIYIYTRTCVYVYIYIYIHLTCNITSTDTCNATNPW